MDVCQLHIPLLFHNRTNSNQCHQRELHKSFDTWTFSTPQILASVFPLDPVSQNYVRQVKNCLFSVIYPIPFKTETQLAAFSESVLNDVLDLPTSVTSSSNFIDFVSGGSVLPGSTPLSHRYGGHQFGYWADQLGDGRAVMLGEYVNP